MLHRQDPPFQLKNPSFVPDKRCEGWYTTNIVGFTGFHESLSLESVQNAHMLLTRNGQDFLNIYSRYRIYFNDEGILIFSVRQEQVNKISDKLSNFRLQAPKPKDFECVKIAIENAPFYRNLMEEFVEMLHNFDLKKDLLDTAKSKAEIAKFNVVADMVNSNKERVVLEYRNQPDKDMFIKTMIRSIFRNTCDCKTDCMWHSYENLWVFQEMIETLGHRSEKQKKKDFGPLFVMTKKVFNKRKSKDGKKAYLKAVDKHVENYRYTSFTNRDVINEMHDNTMIHNIDVVRGRGLWLSHSRTYANWPTESVKKSDSKPEGRVPTRVELLETILNAIGKKHNVEVDNMGKAAGKADEDSSNSASSTRAR